MPTISVCITYYNRPDSLAATLESLLTQTCEPDEVLLWDDCSPRSALPVVKEFQDRFKHFRYHRNEVNLNMPGNLNAVLSQATGDYIANLHDADVFHPELLESWARVLDTHPDAGIVFCRDSRWENPRFVANWTPEPAEITEGKEFFKRFFLGRIDSIIWGTVMARRSLYEKLLPFDSYFENWADVDMWMRFCGQGAISYVPKPLIQLDENPTHSGRFSFARMAKGHEMVLRNIDRILTGAVAEEAKKLQAHAWRNRWRRWMLGRLRRAEWAELKAGWDVRSK